MLFNEPKLLKLFRRYPYASQLPSVSVLFNEPKLLKLNVPSVSVYASGGFSALQRAEIAEIVGARCDVYFGLLVSVLFNEPKLLK